MERARSDDAVLDALLQAAFALHPQEIELSLGRLERLLARLGNPHQKLPPVFHVAGTNGKGSTVAFLRACLEASGRRVHVYTSPHLIRFNERIRIAGHVISDEALSELLREILARNAGQPITFFELTTALAFLAFARIPADACIIEVGMGGRMDATNVIAAPLVTGIAALGLDHQQWLGATILDIAREKAGIAKRGVPMIVSRYPKAVCGRIAEVAGVTGAPLRVRGEDWDVAAYEGALHFRDAEGRLTVPLPRLAGAHQVDNAGLAIAMLRAQTALPVAEAALRAGMGWAEWPARLQRLEPGPLTRLLPPETPVWLDGGHNPAAGRALAESLSPDLVGGRPVTLVVGMLAPKDARGFLKAFTGRVAAVYTVPIPGHAHHDPDALAAAARDCGFRARAAADLPAALDAIAAAADPAQPPLVLIAGSLHLAGHALARNGQSAG
ncbi:bifunctional folylpolyglutamate synthase/dihydrofolate synthase [Polymorphobacter fuscus]|uniref:Dihydrofolate synthase/folylpolyglutamate synthase n=2 Tax=Sandarakinorhabdus fusca TaxID=1439888 RepID=A0A7C9KJ96_9SPHN|nr:bifunctional folylpolyglutamate synthase/dihydrofolate synthase [Polymorphobacter fuscus]MQT17881.1 bifunctional folylpolyglutamate synthase/dihydrofolate synthase [Polymorphobacter fuscus]